jgi:hypothetical protein
MKYLIKSTSNRENSLLIVLKKDYEIIKIINDIILKYDPICHGLEFFEDHIGYYLPNYEKLIGKNFIFFNDDDIMHLVFLEEELIIILLKNSKKFDQIKTELFNIFDYVDYIPMTKKTKKILKK